MRIKLLIVALFFVDAIDIRAEDPDQRIDALNDNSLKLHVKINYQNGIVQMTLSTENVDGMAQWKFNISEKGEPYRFFIKDEEVWVWNEKVGYRLYRVSAERSLKVIDPKIRGIDVPAQIKNP